MKSSRRNTCSRGVRRVRIHTHTHAHTCTHTHSCTCIHTTHSCTHTRIYSHTQSTHTHKLTHSCAHILIHIHIVVIYAMKESKIRYKGYRNRMGREGSEVYICARKKLLCKGNSERRREKQHASHEVICRKNIVG